MTDREKPTLEWCYRTLGLSPGASRDAIRNAYRDLVKVWHPDRFPNDPRLQEKAQETLKEINLAYETLRSGRASSEAARDARTGGVAASRDPWSASRPSEGPRQSAREWRRAAAARAAQRGRASSRSRSALVWAIWIFAIACGLGLAAFHPWSAGGSRADGALGWVSRLRLGSHDRGLPETNPGESAADSGARTIPPPVSAPSPAQAPMSEGAARASSPSDAGGHVARTSENAAVAAPGVFTIGSTKDEVLAIEGRPSQSTNDEWHYDHAVVYFAHGRVTRWMSTTSRPLHARLFPGRPVDVGRGFFTLGSSKDEVLTLEGQPSWFSDDEWHYGDAVVSFSPNGVRGWV
jgi:curved DNA-binding protein CbpA